MAFDLEYLTNVYFSNGENVPFRTQVGQELHIKPILLKDAFVYDSVSDILTIRKNETDEIEVIQMSYLDFLINRVCVDEVNLYRLNLLCSLCFGSSFITFGKTKGKSSLGLCDEEGTIIGIISSKDFDEISKIILHQNNPYYDDRYVNPEVREMMEEYTKAKHSNTIVPSIEKKKAFLCSKINKTFNDIGNITYREFELLYRACLDSEIFLVTKITEASPKYEVKEQTKHPLFEKERDPYEEIFEDTSVLSSKGISGAEQLNALNLNSNN